MPKINALFPGSSSQRNSLNHQAIEDYMKTIYELAQEVSPVSTNRVAAAREVKPASATSMIQRLAKLNLLNYQKHYGVTLTDAGEKLALEVLRHHRLLELYLMEALGFSWDEVHEQADILEHVISEKLEDRIAAILDHPQFDPHGDPIPSKDGVMPKVEGVPLTAVSPPAALRVTRIPDDSNGDLLRHLAALGLVPGQDIQLLQAEPFDGPLTVEILGEQKVIGFKVASEVLVAGSNSS